MLQPIALPLQFTKMLSYVAGDSNSRYTNQIFSQAAYFMHDLRAAMGKTAFHAFLRDYFRQNSGQFVTKETFFTLAQSHTKTDLTLLRSRYFQK